MMQTSQAIGTSRDLCCLLGISTPVFLAGMAGISGPKLASAVSEAGGFGHLGGLRQPPRALRQLIRETRQLTPKPFGINIVPSFGGPEVFAAQARVILEEKPRMISLFYGEFPELIKAAKDAGIIVAVQVGSVAEARTVWEQGADVVVAQGIEAGGHVRGTIALHPLLSAIIPFSAGRPVLAAGGIVTTADAQAAIVHGAHGVWVGTAFIVTPESQAHPVYRRRVIEAGTDDTEFRRGYSFGWKYGTPHRVIPSRRGRNPFNWVGGGVRTSDKASVGEKIALYCGQGCGHITKERPASEIVAELAAAFHTGIPTGAIQAA